MIPASIFCSNCGVKNDRVATFCFACGRQLAYTTSSTRTVQSEPVPSTPDSKGEGQVSVTPDTNPPYILSVPNVTGLLSVNTTLRGRYRVLHVIGRGGMGAVYMGMDIQLGDRLVAIKEMSQSALSSEEAQTAADQFKQEAHMLAGLHHPNLPSIYDHFSEHQRWYLVMSFVQGTTLQEDLKYAPDGKLSLEEVLRVGIELCTVLQYLHSSTPPIVFRDLKPANIMRTKNGHIYLIDFGIARNFKPDQEKDTASYVSFGYAPPEQYGQAQTTPRSDIYSLGVTLYQLLSGYAPAQSPFRLPPLQSLVPTLPARLIALITQMLDLDANQRPTDAMVVKQELQAIINVPVSPPAASAKSQVSVQEAERVESKDVALPVPLVSVSPEKKTSLLQRIIMISGTLVGALLFLLYGFHLVWAMFVDIDDDLDFPLKSLSHRFVEYMQPVSIGSLVAIIILSILLAKPLRITNPLVISARRRIIANIGNSFGISLFIAGIVRWILLLMNHFDRIEDGGSASIIESFLYLLSTHVFIIACLLIILLFTTRSSGLSATRTGQAMLKRIGWIAGIAFLIPGILCLNPNALRTLFPFAFSLLLLSGVMILVAFLIKEPQST